MDLLPASSLLSPLSRALIHRETQFHLSEPAFLPVLIYGPDRDWREPEREGGGGSGGLQEGERAEVGTAWGPLIHCLLTGQDGSRHGKSLVGALLSAGAVRLCGLCGVTLTPNERNWPSRVYNYNVCARSREAESMWVP